MTFKKIIKEKDWGEKFNKLLTWHYNIVKQDEYYYIAEVVGDDSWVLYEDTASDTAQDLYDDLTSKLLDCINYPILEVKKNKLCKLKNK